MCRKWRYFCLVSIHRLARAYEECTWQMNGIKVLYHLLESTNLLDKYASFLATISCKLDSALLFEQTEKSASTNTNFIGTWYMSCFAKFKLCKERKNANAVSHIHLKWNSVCVEWIRIAWDIIETKRQQIMRVQVKQSTRTVYQTWLDLAVGSASAWYKTLIKL